MKKICIYLFIFLFPYLTFAKIGNADTIPPPLFPNNSKETNQNCYHNSKLTNQERKNIFPFNKASKVAIVSFPSFHEKVSSIKDSLIRETIVLSEKQIDKLTDILYNYNYSKKTKVFMETHNICGCAHMRHVIFFMDNEEDIIAYMQIDFSETHIETDFPDESIGAFCEGKYKLLKSFFKTVGIKQFDNKVEEEQDIKLIRIDN